MLRLGALIVVFGVFLHPVHTLETEDEVDELFQLLSRTDHPKPKARYPEESDNQDGSDTNKALPAIIVGSVW